MALDSFSVDRAPTAQRALLFRRHMEDHFSVGLAIEGAGGRPLSTQVSSYCGRSLRFASLSFSAHRTCAAAPSLARASRVLVTMQDEGVAHVSQDGRQSDVAPGEFCLIDPDRPFRIETTQMRSRSLYLDRVSLVSACPQMTALTARSMSGSAGPGSIFRSMLDEIFRIGPTLDEDTADSIADALPYVLATALQAVKKDLVPESSRLRSFHQQRIRRFARGSLRDPRLDARTIASGVNLSLRYVCDIFAHEPQSLMKWVWSERLEHCRRDLADAALGHRSISAVAYGWGFSDVTHFSRAFRRHFGESPRDWRRQSQSGTAACAQGARAQGARFVASTACTAGVDQPLRTPHR